MVEPGSRLEAAAVGFFTSLLARTHLSQPADAPGAAVEELSSWLDAGEVVLYVANREQTELVALAAVGTAQREPQSIDGSMAGRAFVATTLVETAGSSPGRRRAWLPVLDGTDRLGVLELEVAGDDSGLDPDLVLVLERAAHALAQVLVAKAAYGDVIEDAKRSQPMSLGAELLWSVVPPLTFATDGLVISAMLEPAYSNGGDAFDYAVNGDRTHLAVFDGMGHGLAAAGVSTFAVAAYRHSRRAGQDLEATYAAMDAAVTEQFAGDRFVTALLAQLDVSSGRLRWVSAGHPPPLLVRDERVVKVLEADPATPLGMPMFGTAPVVAEEQLLPGDTVLLYTDGVTEARRPGHGQLGVEGFCDFVRRESAAGHSPAETLRRLRRALLERQEGKLDDDATVLMVDWRGGTERRLLPPTVD